MKLDEPTTLVQLLLGSAFAVLAASAASLLFGHAITPATFGLAAVIAALLGLLRALYRIVSVLGRPDQGLDFVADEGRSARAWREEKKRALRAIKELDFDYSMRKISESDYETIRTQYSERALVAMRALDESDKLHPALERDLELQSHFAPRIDSNDTACPACMGQNDVDAKFCKHCGASLG